MRRNPKRPAIICAKCDPKRTNDVAGSVEAECNLAHLNQISFGNLARLWQPNATNCMSLRL